MNVIILARSMDVCASDSMRVMKCMIMYYKQTARPRCATFCRWMHVDKVHFRANFHQFRQCPWTSFSRSKFQIEYIGKFIVINSQPLTDRTNIAIAIQELSRLHVAFQLAYLHFTLAHSKVQVQGHAHFYYEYILQTATDRIKIGIANKQKVA